MTAPLHRLPDGAWISLEDVARIVTRDKIPEMPSPSVGIGGTAGWWHTLYFESVAEAQAYADELGRLVNASRTEKRNQPSKE